MATGAGVNVGGGALRSFGSSTKLDPGELARLLRGPDGPVYRRLFILGDEVVELAKKYVGVSKPDPIPRRKPRVPGTMRDSIVKRVMVEGDEVKVRVGTADKAAMSHHQGTPGGQEIVARPGKVLCFFANGEVVFTKRVKRGATPANPFLVRALKEAT